MDPALIFGLLGVLVTAVVAPRLDGFFKRRYQKEDAQQTVQIESNRTSQTELSKRFDTLLDQMNDRAKASDLRELDFRREIDVLRQRINELEERLAKQTSTLIQYEAGTKAAPGWVAVPKPVFDQLRHRVPELLPSAVYPGEDVEKVTKVEIVNPVQRSRDTPPA